MTKLWDELDLPDKRGVAVLLRTPREGAYWQLQDGLIVRVAAAETVHDVEGEQRALLALAARDAVGQKGSRG